MFLVTQHKEVSTGIRKLFHKYWDYLGFVTNSILFFVIGIPLLAVESYQSNAVPLILILVTPFVIMMFSRAVVIYSGTAFLRIFRVRIPLQWQNVLILGGLRGGIAVALVLSLSSEYQFKDLFISIVVPLIAINLVVNPILLNLYLKKTSSKMEQS
jgi:NhaP-type Na+/H+ and K+/H+ antiporters